MFSFLCEIVRLMPNPQTWRPGPPPSDPSSLGNPICTHITAVTVHLYAWSHHRIFGLILKGNATTTADNCLLECNVMQSDMSLSVFQRDLLSLSSGQRNKLGIEKSDIDMGRGRQDQDPEDTKRSKESRVKDIGRWTSGSSCHSNWPIRLSPPYCLKMEAEPA